MENITDIIRIEVKKFDMHPYDINNGYCEEFADIIYNKIKDCEIMAFPLESKYFGHIFIKYNNKYYDAESPYGEIHWKYLPIFRKR
jgi:hypothetical protein